MDETRASLIRRVRDPADVASWDEFHSLYKPFLINIARRNALSEQDADDLVQEVFIKVVEAIKQFELDKKRGRFRGWLKTIAIRKLIDLKRSRGRAATVPLKADPSIDDPLQQEWDREYRQHVLEFAQVSVREKVEPKTWACFVEHTLNRRPAAEVATQLELNVNAVYQNAARTLKRIRETCLDYEESLVDE